MTAPTAPVYVVIEAERVTESLANVRDQLPNGGEVELGFKAVRRITPGAMRELELLARAAEEKHVKVTIRQIRVSVYKVLKLARLSSRFAFVE